MMLIAGLDEVGVRAITVPLVAVAVFLPSLGPPRSQLAQAAGASHETRAIPC